MKRVLASILLTVFFATSSVAANYVGDYAPGDTVDCNFGTVRPSTGASFTLGGTPAISAYKDNSTTQSTTGITLSADFDGMTGANHVRVTTGSDGTFYSAGSFIELFITTGTVDSVSVVGQPVCSFTLNKVSALRPTTAARTLDVAATGEAGIDLDNVLFSGNGPLPAFGVIDRGTAQAADANGITLRAGFSTNAANMVGVTVWIYSSTNGLHARGVSTAYNNTSKVLSLSGLGEAPTGTVLYVVFATGGFDASSVRSALGMASANMDTQFSGIQSDTDNIQTRLPAALSGGRMDSITNAMGTDVITNTAIAASAVTELQSGLATAAALTTLDGKVDTVDTVVDAIKLKTDQLTFGVANTLNVNVEYQNAAQMCGDGTSGDKWRACP